MLRVALMMPEQPAHVIKPPQERVLLRILGIDDFSRKARGGLAGKRRFPSEPLEAIPGINGFIWRGDEFLNISERETKRDRRYLQSPRQYKDFMKGDRCPPATFKVCKDRSSDRHAEFSTALGKLLRAHFSINSRRLDALRGNQGDEPRPVFRPVFGPEAVGHTRGARHVIPSRLCHDSTVRQDLTSSKTTRRLCAVNTAHEQGAIS